MKNTKAVFLIVLGSFLLATGLAFAENVAYEQLKNSVATPPAVAFDKTSEALPEGARTAKTAADPVAERLAAIKASNIKAAAPAPAPTPEPKPTIGKSIKNFIGEHKKEIVFGGIGAWLGFMILGTVAGALTGGVGFIALLWFANL